MVKSWITPHLKCLLNCTPEQRRFRLLQSGGLLGLELSVFCSAKFSRFFVFAAFPTSVNAPRKRNLRPTYLLKNKEWSPTFWTSDPSPPPRLLKTPQQDVDDVGSELKGWLEDITPEWIRRQGRMRKMSNSRRLEEVRGC